MANYEFMLTDSLEKVFPDKRPERRLGQNRKGSLAERETPCSWPIIWGVWRLELNEQEIAVSLDSGDW